MRPHTQTAPSGYELLDEVGRGGMGVVYRARHQALDRDIALKFLKDDSAPDSPAARRFVEEAKITARLQHPGIPSVHELGTLPDGRPFLAMKLIQGRTLAAHLADRERERPETAKWLGVFETICHAVGAAHAAGYIHRDLKPGNVMVGAFGEVQVMDWGLAKFLASRERERPEPSKPPVAHAPGSPASDDTLPVADASSERNTDRTNPYQSPDDSDGTRAGTVMGTPSYMAPEQARGDVELVDRRSDVFALGAILCQILTGKPPLSGSSAQVVVDCAAGRFDEAYRRLDGCGEDPALIALAKRCLSVNPDDRPADASEVATAVATFRSETEARAKQAEVERGKAEVQTAEQRKRQRVWRWSAVAVIGVLTLGVIGTAIGLVQAENRRLEADQARGREKDRADGEERASAKMLTTLDLMVSEITGDSLATQKAITLEQKKFLEEVLTNYREFAGQQAADEKTRARIARAAFQVGVIEFRFGRNERGVAAYERARDEFAKLAAEYPAVPIYCTRLIDSHINLGTVLFRLGQRAEAEAEYRKGLARVEKLVADFPAVPECRHILARNYGSLGNLLGSVGQRAEAEVEYRKGLACLEKLAAEYPAVPGYRYDLARSHTNLGNLLLFSGKGKKAEAEAEYRKGLACLEKLMADFPAEPEYPYNLAVLHNNLGHHLSGLGKANEAAAEYRKGLPHLEKLVADFPAVPKYRIGLAHHINGYAVLLSDLGTHAAAEQHLNRAVAILEHLIQESPNVPDFHRMLGDALTNRSRARVVLGSVRAAAADISKAATVMATALRLDRAGTETHLRRSGGSLFGGNTSDPDWRDSDPTTPARLRREEGEPKESKPRR